MIRLGARRVIQARNFSNSISYSGGHAGNSQGGFYGSGGSRKLNPKTTVEHRKEAVAHVDDINSLGKIMNDFYSETDKKAQKKIIINPEAMELLERLEFGGEPVWGLTVSERELVYAARQASNEI